MSIRSDCSWRWSLFISSATCRSPSLTHETKTILCSSLLCETKSGPNLHLVEDPDLHADHSSSIQEPSRHYRREASSMRSANCTLTNACVSLYAVASLVAIQHIGTYCWSPAPRSADQHRPSNDAHKYSRDHQTLVLRLRSLNI